MTSSTIAPWLAAPLAEFVREARVRSALVLEPSGRVLAQHGFARSLDVMAACSLAAAIHASSSELGRQLDGNPFGPLHTAGASHQLFLAPLRGGRNTLLLLAVFDDASSLGIVRHFFGAFAERAMREPPAEADETPLALDFERDLGRNLAVLFGRA